MKARLWDLSRMPASVLPAKALERARIARSDELGTVDTSVLLPIAPRPQDIQLIVAGGQPLNGQLGRGHVAGVARQLAGLARGIGVVTNGLGQLLHG